MVSDTKQTIPPPALGGIDTPLMKLAQLSDKLKAVEESDPAMSSHLLQALYVFRVAVLKEATRLRKIEAAR